MLLLVLQAGRGPDTSEAGLARACVSRFKVKERYTSISLTSSLGIVAYSSQDSVGYMNHVTVMLSTYRMYARGTPAWVVVIGISVVWFGSDFPVDQKIFPLPELI